MKLSLSDLVKYTKKFYNYAGRKFYILLVLGFFPGLTDSMGVAVMLPLLLLFDKSQSGIVNAEESQFALGILDFFNIPHEFSYVLIFIAGIFIFKFLIIVFEATYRSVIIANMVKDVREDLLKNFLKMDYLYFQKKNTGYFLNLIYNQSNTMVSGYLCVTQFYAKLLTSLAYIGFSFYLNWQFSLVAVLSGAIVLILLRKFNQVTKKVSRQMVGEINIISNQFAQMIHGFKYLKSTNAFIRYKPRILKSIKNLKVLRFKSDNVTAINKAVSEPIGIIILLIMIYVQVVYMDQGIATLFVNIYLFHRTISFLMATQVQWQTVLQAAGSIDVVEEELVESAKNAEIVGSQKGLTFNDSIVFDGITFLYPGNERPILRDVNLTIEKNKTVAFVGESGAGKSTLIDIVSFVLKPLRGRVLVDGMALADADLDNWRDKIGLISQDIFLFDDTIANNITLWAGDYNNPADREKIERYAKLAHCHDFIMNLPQGYNTIIGEKGMKLSGGQKQRLTIARELFKEPELLMLDEATSALDSESETLIQHSIKAMQGKITVIVIAHRLSTIRDADLIYVMKNGEVVEQGGYDELLSKNEGAFKRMVEYQTL